MKKRSRIYFFGAGIWLFLAGADFHSEKIMFGFFLYAMIVALLLGVLQYLSEEKGRISQKTVEIIECSIVAITTLCLLLSPHNTYF